ncbi:hypothetical protein ACFE04_021554 [Oxalis oulophora]
MELGVSELSPSSGGTCFFLSELSPRGAEELSPSGAEGFAGIESQTGTQFGVFFFQLSAGSGLNSVRIMEMGLNSESPLLKKVWLYGRPLDTIFPIQPRNKFSPLNFLRISKQLLHYRNTPVPNPADKMTHKRTGNVVKDRGGNKKLYLLFKRERFSPTGNECAGYYLTHTDTDGSSMSFSLHFLVMMKYGEEGINFGVGRTNFSNSFQILYLYIFAEIAF